MVKLSRWPGCDEGLEALSSDRSTAQGPARFGGLPPMRFFAYVLLVAAAAAGCGETAARTLPPDVERDASIDLDGGIDGGSGGVGGVGGSGGMGGDAGSGGVGGSGGGGSWCGPPLRACKVRPRSRPARTLRASSGLESPSRSRTRILSRSRRYRVTTCLEPWGGGHGWSSSRDPGMRHRAESATIAPYKGRATFARSAVSGTDDALFCLRSAGRCSHGRLW